MSGRGESAHPIAIARRATRQRANGGDDGFTLIEIIIVVAILPIVLGAIAMALVSVFSLQGSVGKTVADSNDALVGSSYFNRDVQSATNMTVQPQMGTINAVNYYGCGQSSTTQTQLLGLEWGANSSAAGGFQTFVSYVSVSKVNLQTGKTTYTLLRQVCSSGASVTPTSTITVSHDVGSASAVHVYESGASGPFTEVTGTPGDPFVTWFSTQGVTKVAFTTNEPGSGFSYSLVGLPATSQSQSSGTTTTLPSTGNGCSFATPGSGQYSNQLCFVDFTGYTGNSAANCQQMSGPVQNTPYTISFCISQTTSVYSPNQTAYADAPWPIPTYYNQTFNSEAFLGNNGFYTGIGGKPALYEHTCSPAADPTSSPCDSGGQWTMSTVTISNFKVLDAAGQSATGWTLVTGDAESTDSGEWMIFQNQSGVPWSVLYNSPNNPYGNACYNDNTQQIPAGDTTSGFLAYNAKTAPTVGNPVPVGDTSSITLGAQGQTGTTSVLCESDQQLNKTGTLMLSAPVPTTGSSESFSVTMNGHGWGEALFLGVFL
jgi:prepilin-type N-terminal cleavage/methylation domain-containing protein